MNGNIGILGGASVDWAGGAGWAREKHATGWDRRAAPG